MKQIISKLICLLAISVFFLSCEKDDIQTYNSEKNAVRFPYRSFHVSESPGYDIDNRLFRASFSFVENPLAVSEDFDLPIMLVGTASTTDRHVAYSIDTENTTAPAGSYEILDAVIPADSIRGHIRIRLNNAEELTEQTYELYITLQPSSELAVGPNQFLRAVVSWDNIIQAPTNAQHARTYNMLIQSNLNFIATSLNAYSSKALQTIVTALGWDDWDNQEVHGTKYNSPTYQSYKYLPRYTMIYTDNSYKSYALKLSNYIRSYNEAHPDAPLVHNAGSLKGQPIEARSY